MDSMKSLTLFVLVCLLLLPGCGFPGCGEDAPDHDIEYGDTTGEGLDVASLTYGMYQLFKTSGISAEIGPVVETPYFDQAARGIKVNGSPVMFLEYSNDRNVEEVVASISSDGKKIGDKVVTEEKTPHFFRKGKVIAFYFGDKESTLEALTLTMGAQFAGG